MKKKIDFLNRLFDLIKCKITLLEYLRDEKLITDDTMQHLMSEHSSMHAQRLLAILDRLKGEDKLQLVDYEWTLLPHEHLKLIIVSNNNKREFEYNG